ncbi:MAG: Uma2 family endonuclease [Thermus sp.]|uniref:Uma2 family endonuclease n=1 Tax=Thermus sp. TaxID=275 RepID=UPI00351AE08E
MPREAPLRRASFEEFLPLEATSPERHEYVEGLVCAMTVGSEYHNRLMARILLALLPVAEAAGCKAFAEGMLLRVEEAAYYPDVFVTCEELLQGAHYKETTCLVVEVLSESTEVVALLALGLGQEGTAALVLGGGVGCTGPLLLKAPPEALRLGGALLLHRLALALPLLLLNPKGILALHVGYHALALLAFPLLFPPLHRLMIRFLPPEPPLAPKYLRPEALEDPPLAQALALRELARIGDAARAMLARTLEALRKEEGREADLGPLEEKVDRLSREVLLYVARLPEAASLPYLKAAAELEHLADLAKRILRKAERLWGQGITFSPEGRQELVRLLALTLARLEKALAALATADPHLARRVQAEGFQEALEASRQAHRKRLQEREESRASTLAHLDLLLLLEEFNQGISRLARLVEEIRP